MSALVDGEPIDSFATYSSNRVVNVLEGGGSNDDDSENTGKDQEQVCDRVHPRRAKSSPISKLSKECRAKQEKKLT